MAMILRVKSIKEEPVEGHEYPIPVWRTTSIIKAPNGFDYGAMCDDSSSVEVIADFVPDDTPMQTWDMKAQTHRIREESEICEAILDNANSLMCFNCGERLTEVSQRIKGIHDAVGILRIDPGENNYPHSPDEPACAYFECMECHNEHKPET